MGFLFFIFRNKCCWFLILSVNVWHAFSQQELCDNQTSRLSLSILKLGQTNNCAFSLSGTTKYTNHTCESFMAGEANTNPCPLGLPCIGTCYEWQLFLDNSLIETACNNDRTHIFSNLSSKGVYKIIVVYRRWVLCNNNAVCALIVEEGQVTIGENICDFLSYSHNSNQPAIIKRQHELNINCSIENNQTTVLVSANKIKALPGSRSGSGASAFFHAYIDECYNENSGSEIKSNIQIYDDFHFTLESISLKEETDSILDRSYPANFKIIIHPNPNLGQFNITLPAEIQHAEILIYDPIGRLIQQVKVNDTHIQFDLSGYSPGIYFVKISDGETVKIEKVIYHR
jgi:hypothetical protein